MEVSYSPTFVKQFTKLEEDLQEEVLEKIELLKDLKKHEQIKVHKLHGRLSGRYSFSVNYKIRIVFMYLNNKKDEAFLLSIGDHDIYK